MGWAAASIVFTISWCLVFLAMLPIGVRSQWEDDSTVPGTEESAPKDPMLVKKALWATGGAALLTGIAALVIPLIIAG
jgi:predicted secreted protein